MSTWEALIHSMFICEVNNMRNFIFGAIMASFRKKPYDLHFLTQFSQFLNIKKLTLIRFLITILSPLG
jgi:hypothetical protein